MIKEKNEQHLAISNKGLMHLAQQEFTLYNEDTPTVYYLMGRILALEEKLAEKEVYLYDIIDQ